MSDESKPQPTAANRLPEGSPEPFQRKVITWGRMPATTFHVGPVPVAPNPLDRIPNRPPLKTPLGQGQNQTQAQTRGPARGVLEGGLQPRRTAPRPSGAILTGSLIPQARPAAATPTAPTSVSNPDPAAGPQSAVADTTVRPLPAPEPGPEVAALTAEPPIDAASAEAPVTPPIAPLAPSSSPASIPSPMRTPRRSERRPGRPPPGW